MYIKLLKNNTSMWNIICIFMLERIENWGEWRRVTLCSNPKADPTNNYTLLESIRNKIAQVRHLYKGIWTMLRVSWSHGFFALHLNGIFLSIGSYNQYGITHPFIIIFLSTMSNLMLTFYTPTLRAVKRFLNPLPLLVLDAYLL